MTFSQLAKTSLLLTWLLLSGPGLANSCLLPLDEDVNKSGPALRPAFFRASQTENRNQVAALDLASSLNSGFSEIDYRDLVGASASQYFSCTSSSGFQPTTSRFRLGGRSSALGKRYHLQFTLSAWGAMDVLGHPEVETKAYFNGRLVWDSKDEPGTWNGLGEPCFGAPTASGTIQVRAVLAAGEAVDLRVETTSMTVNYLGDDLIYPRASGVGISDVVVLDVEEDPRSDCDACRFEGCGTVSVGSSAFEMSVGTAGAGSLRMGSIGRLSLSQRYVTDPTSPIHETLDYFDQQSFPGFIIHSASSRLEGAWGVNGAAYISYVSDDSFQIDWYSADQATYPPTGSPDRSYAIDRSTVGNVTTVDVDEIIGTTTLSSQLQWDSASQVLTVNYPGVIRRDVMSRGTSGGIRTDTYEVIDPLNGNQVVSKAQKRYQDMGWGEVLISNQKDPDNGGELVSYTYVTNSSENGYRDLDSISSSYGPKVFFDYDSEDLIYREYWGWKDQAANEVWDQGRTREYLYTPIVGSGDTGSWKPSEPRIIREYIDGDLVRQSYLILDHNNLVRTEVQFMDNGTGGWTDSRHPRKTTNFQTTSGFSQGYPEVIYQDSYWTTFAYSFDGISKEQTTTVSVNGYNNEGLITTRIQGVAGQLVKETQTDKKSSIKLNETIYSNFDELHRAQLVTYFDGTTETYSYGCCGIDSMTDRDGVVSSYSYDDLKRRISQSRLGIDLFWDFDAADNLLSMRRKGTDTSEIVLQSSEYGLDGMITSHTNALQGVSTLALSTLPGGQSQQTAVAADGGTLLTTYYLDGQVASITGTASFPESFIPSTEATSYGSKVYTAVVQRRTALDDQGLGTNEWVETLGYQDGRPRITRYANALSPTIEEVHYWTGSFRPNKRADPDGVLYRYGYDQFHRLTWTGIDVDANGWFVAAGPDRIHESLYDAATYTDGTTYDVVRTQKRVYPTNGSATSILVSESIASTDGQRRWDINYPTPSTPSVTKTEISYSGNQRTEAITEPSGRRLVREFTNGRLITEKTTDTNGQTLTQQTNAYDPHGRVASVTDLRTGTTDFTYNNADQVLTVTTPPDPDNVRHVTTTSYDTSLRPTQVQQPDGGIVYTQYDLKGQVTKTFGARTYPVEFTYDSQGRRRTMTTWKNFDEGTGFGISGSAVTRWNYDPYRGWLSSKDYPDETTGQAPATEGTGGPVYTYTDAGRMATRTWQRGVVTTYNYDASTGDLDTVSYSDSTTSLAHAYNRQGQVTSTTQGSKVTSFSYDNVGNKTNESVLGGPIGGLSFTRTLDGALRPSNDQFDIGATLIAATSYAYSSTTGRLSSVSDGGTLGTYSYLPNSSLIQSLTFGTGALVTTRSYDNLNRLSSISNAASGEVLPVSFSYTYNLANQRTRTDEADGKHWTYGYDDLGQLTQGNHRLSDGTVLGGQDFDYAFDEIGNRNNTGGRASAQSAYTSNYRNEYEDRSVPALVDILGIDDPLSTVTVEGQTATRSGEYFHSEVSVSNGSNPVYPTIDITTTSNGGQTVNGQIYVPEDSEIFEYDDDGNLSKDGRWHYTWDAENRLVQMHTIAGVPLSSERRLEFEYDYLGRRIDGKIFDRSSGGAQIGRSRYLYDGWNLIAELDSAGFLVRRYLWGTDLSGSFQGAGGVGGLIALVDHSGATPETHYVSYDGNGNVATLTDPITGEWSARYEYGPFGEPIRTTGDPIAHTNPFRFSTKYTDPESGFLNYGHRLYNPTTGRWLSKDPIEEDGGLNLYGFVLNNSINAYDILGLADDENYEDLDKRLESGKAFGSYFYDEETRETYDPIDEKAIEDLKDTAKDIGIEVGMTLFPIRWAGKIIGFVKVPVKRGGEIVIDKGKDFVGWFKGRFARGKESSFIPTTRYDLHLDLKEKGFDYKGTSPRGHATYKGPDGRKVVIKPSGEVIPVQRVPKSDGTGKFPQRQDYFGNPIDGQSHETGHFVEPLKNVLFKR